MIQGNTVGRNCAGLRVLCTTGDSRNPRLQGPSALSTVPWLQGEQAVRVGVDGRQANWLASQLTQGSRPWINESLDGEAVMVGDRQRSMQRLGRQFSTRALSVRPACFRMQAPSSASRRPEELVRRSQHVCIKRSCVPPTSSPLPPKHSS